MIPDLSEKKRLGGMGGKGTLASTVPCERMVG